MEKSGGARKILLSSWTLQHENFYKQAIIPSRPSASAVDIVEPSKEK